MSNTLANLTINGCLCLGCCLLGEGTNRGTIRFNSDFDYSINAAIYRKAATNNIDMTDRATQPAWTTCFYVVGINAAGDVIVYKGTHQPNGSGKPLFFPEIPDGIAVVGGIKVKTTTQAFDTNGSDLGAQGIIETYYNWLYLPSNLHLA